jgi:hypothetical protein
MPTPLRCVGVAQLCVRGKDLNREWTIGMDTFLALAVHDTDVHLRAWRSIPQLNSVVEV